MQIEINLPQSGRQWVQAFMEGQKWRTSMFWKAMWEQYCKMMCHNNSFILFFSSPIIIGRQNCTKYLHFCPSLVSMFRCKNQWTNQLHDKNRTKTMSCNVIFVYATLPDNMFQFYLSSPLTGVENESIYWFYSKWIVFSEKINWVDFCTFSFELHFLLRKIVTLAHERKRSQLRSI